MSGNLDAAGIARLLVERGVVDAEATATELPGGVSNTVVLVVDASRRLVVKQSLPRLKVADEWLAKQERLLTEAAALQLAGEITPGAVPAVVHVDEASYVMAIEAAPPHWRDWKQDLLQGHVDVEIAAALGQCLGAWHRVTAGDDAVARRFNDLEAFEQLRVDPYYRTVAARVPEVKAAIDALIERMSQRSACLVHGDFSPKNVLVGDGESWVLDWEVAHVGDPSFDVAFLTNHLVLKAIHGGDEAAPTLQAAAARFWSEYEQEIGAMGHEVERTLCHLGGLLLARACGKSPAEYLDETGRERAAAIGRSLLLEPASTLEQVWERVV